MATNEQFEEFKKELIALCIKHGVCITTSMYDAIEVHALLNNEYPLCCNGFVNKINYRPNLTYSERKV